MINYRKTKQPYHNSHNVRIVQNEPTLCSILFIKYTALYALDYQSDTTNVEDIAEGILKDYEY